MSILGLLNCFEPRKFERSNEPDRRVKAAASLSEAKTPPPQDDIFSDFFKNVQKIGENAEKSFQELGKNFEDFGQHLQQGWGKFEQDITGLFEPKPNSDGNTELSSSNSLKLEIGSDTSQPREAAPSKPPSPASSSGSGLTVRFSDETKTTSKDGARNILYEQKKLVEIGISQNGELLSSQINQQFPNFRTLKKLQAQFLATKKEITDLSENLPPTHSQAQKKRKELDSKIEEIETIQRYLALGGEVDNLQASSICAQYINKTSSRSLNLEEETTLLNKIWRIRSKFNAREGRIAQIKHSSSILETSINNFKKEQFKILDPARRFDQSKLDSTIHKKLTEIESMSMALRGSDEKTEVAREYLKNAFKYLVLGGKDLVLISNSLSQVKTANNISDSQLKNIEPHRITNKINVLQQKFINEINQRFRQSQSG